MSLTGVKFCRHSGDFRHMPQDCPPGPATLFADGAGAAYPALTAALAARTISWVDGKVAP